jgi:hypothetical protein
VRARAKPAVARCGGCSAERGEGPC